MTIRRTRVVLDPPTRVGPETVHAVRCETSEVVDGVSTRGQSVSFTVVLRSLDPTVSVQGVTLAWEARLRVSDDRVFDGYGPDAASAFDAAHRQATASGLLTDAAWRSVAGSLAATGAFGETAKRKSNLS